MVGSYYLSPGYGRSLSQVDYSGSSKWREWSMTLQMDLLLTYFQGENKLPSEWPNATDAILNPWRHAGGEVARKFGEAMRETPVIVSQMNNNGITNQIVGNPSGDLCSQVPNVKTLSDMWENMSQSDEWDIGGLEESPIGEEQLADVTVSYSDV